MSAGSSGRTRRGLVNGGGPGGENQIFAIVEKQKYLSIWLVKIRTEIGSSVLGGISETDLRGATKYAGGHKTRE